MNILSEPIVNALEHLAPACLEYQTALNQYRHAARNAEAECSRLYSGKLLVHRSAEAIARDKHQEQIWSKTDRFSDAVQTIRRTTRHDAIWRLVEAVKAESGQEPKILTLFDGRADGSIPVSMLANDIAEALTLRDEEEHAAILKTLKPLRKPVAGTPVIEYRRTPMRQCGTLLDGRNGRVTVRRITNDGKFRTNLWNLCEVPKPLYATWLAAQARRIAIAAEVQDIWSSNIWDTLEYAANPSLRLDAA